MNGNHILLVIGGGIAAYKSLDLIRRLRRRGAVVRVVLTGAGEKFVTPLSVTALAGTPVHTDLFSPAGEAEIGHIRLAREADLIVVAPATADFIARMAHGHGDDLATTVLLARDGPVLLAPAMNVRMWTHPATRRNVAQLLGDGAQIVGPDVGDLACGEEGLGRMAEVGEIVTVIGEMIEAGEVEGFEAGAAPGMPLAGRHVLVTSGPTHEAIDPVRYIANRSSGRQGHAIAAAAARLGADVTLVSGPVGLTDPAGRVHTVHVRSAREMLEAVQTALPVDVAICAAAVADWRVARPARVKLKKAEGKTAGTPTLELVENPDILKTLAEPGPKRPELVIGFAAETSSVLANAKAKRRAKGCDWMVANDVSEASGVTGGVFGGARNRVHLVTASGAESWPEMSKKAVARELVQRAAALLAERKGVAE